MFIRQAWSRNIFKLIPMHVHIQFLLRTCELALNLNLISQPIIILIYCSCMCQHRKRSQHEVQYKCMILPLAPIFVPVLMFLHIASFHLLATMFHEASYMHSSACLWENMQVWKGEGVDPTLWPINIWFLLRLPPVGLNIQWNSAKFHINISYGPPRHQVILVIIKVKKSKGPTVFFTYFCGFVTIYAFVCKKI